MKQTVLAIMCIAAVMTMTACGGGNSKKQDSGKKTDVEAATELVSKAENKSITNDNWQEYVKKEFGFDFPIPNGWTFKQVNALNFSETIITLLIDFGKSGDNSVNVSETAKTLFDRTKALSSDGNFSVDVNVNSGAMSKGKTFSTFQDRFTPTLMYDGITDIEADWYYKTSEGIKLVDISAEKGNMRVKLEFNKSLKL